jgi:arylsulfatase A-like enzyme
MTRLRLEAMRPNVLLVVLDAARRDALEPYGASPGSTPSIAQLASRGAAFPDVYATACWTVPSHASIFTGLMPRAAGLAQVETPSASRPILDSQRERLLPEVMRRAGYATAAFSSNLWIAPGSGFDAGFDTFASADSGREAQLHGESIRARMRWLAEAARGRVDDGAAAVRVSLEKQIGSAPRQPFFWFVNLIECHSPYLPPRPAKGVSTLDRLRAAEDARRYYTFPAIWRACVGGFDVPDETLERLRRLYRASIRYMDDWLAELLERLDRAGVLDDTLVIVTSDHGENFGEGDLIAHAFSLDNRLIHVPFVAAGPGGAGAEITSLAEVPRHIAGAAGIEDDAWADGPPHGVGVAQFDPAARPDDPTLLEALDRWGLGDDALRRITTPLTCTVAGDLKVLRRGEREEVYDLRADPLETDPVAPDAIGADRAGRLAELRAALEHPAVTARHAAEAPGRQASAEELTDLEERMKLLGYM